MRCVDCAHARGEACMAHPGSGLATGCIGGITELLQHCPAFEAREVDE